MLDFDDVEAAWEVTNEEMTKRRENLLAQIWEEQVNYLFNSTFVTVEK